MNDHEAELNPGHPVTTRLRDQYAKVLTIVLWKYRGVLPTDVALTTEDFNEFSEFFGDDMGTLIVNDRDGALHISVIRESEGRELMRREAERG